jgi:hypothetical protein
VVRASYYPAWQANVAGSPVALYDSEGQLAFRAPRDGSYTVRLEYPRYGALSLIAVVALLGGMAGLSRWPGSREGSLE